MEFVKLSHTDFTSGSIVNNVEAFSWIERYRDAGEFHIETTACSNLMAALPVGSLLTHTETAEVMIVENHSVTEDEDSQATLKISGRTFETYLENRIVGANKAWPSAAGSTPPIPELASAYTWNQAVVLIDKHITPGEVYNASDGVPNVDSFTGVVIFSGAAAPIVRPLERKTVYLALTELLQIDDLGIRTHRPRPDSPFGPTSVKLALEVHRGVDRTGQVMFSHRTGDITNAQYLWTNKKLKNAALISGKWVQVMVYGSETGYDRRVMYIDAHDLDERFISSPVGSDWTNISNQMTTRANQALSAQSFVEISSVEISQSIDRYQYRRDYNVGDLVTVEGNYNTSTTMRITEHVETMDENGYVAYPTVSTI